MGTRKVGWVYPAPVAVRACCGGVALLLVLLASCLPSWCPPRAKSKGLGASACSFGRDVANEVIGGVVVVDGGWEFGCGLGNPGLQGRVVGGFRGFEGGMGTSRLKSGSDVAREKGWGGLEMTGKTGAGIRGAGPTWCALAGPAGVRVAR